MKGVESPVTSRLRGPRVDLSVKNPRSGFNREVRLRGSRKSGFNREGRLRGSRKDDIVTTLTFLGVLKREILERNLSPSLSPDLFD